MDDEGNERVEGEEDESGRVEVEEDEDMNFIHLKWSADGAGTLSEVASILEELAQNYREMERNGWQLIGTVDGGYAIVEQN